jgi:hypothetical protein
VWRHSCRVIGSSASSLSLTRRRRPVSESLSRRRPLAERPECNRGRCKPSRGLDEEAVLAGRPHPDHALPLDRERLEGSGRCFSGGREDALGSDLRAARVLEQLLAGAGEADMNLNLPNRR